MRKRPQIVEGDVVKLSKKGKDKYLELYHNATMIVHSIYGDGIEGNCPIDVVFGNEILRFERRSLWKTGFNVHGTNGTELDINAPLNNNSRDTCYVCQMPTKTITLLASDHQICTNPNCVWFEN